MCVERIMENGTERVVGVRRLPVVDDVLVGVVIPLAQIAQAAAEPAERADITPLDPGRAFAEISCPLHRQPRA